MAERRKGKGPSALGSVVDGLMAGRGLRGRRRVSEEIETAWQRAAGPELAQHTCIRGLRRGVLTIDVDSPPLCHQLASFQRERLLLALQEHLRRTAVTDLRFRLGEFARERKDD